MLRYFPCYQIAWWSIFLVTFLAFLTFRFCTISRGLATKLAVLQAASGIVLTVCFATTAWVYGWRGFVGQVLTFWFVITPATQLVLRQIFPGRPLHDREMTAGLSAPLLRDLHIERLPPWDDKTTTYAQLMASGPSCQSCMTKFPRGAEMNLVSLPSLDLFHSRGFRELDLKGRWWEDDGWLVCDDCIQNAMASRDV
ncbi:hypothetical protein ACFL2T_02350 [Elusimicrobiota bacterium]